MRSEQQAHSGSTACDLSTSANKMNSEDWLSYVLTACGSVLGTTLAWMVKDNARFSKILNQQTELNHKTEALRVSINEQSDLLRETQAGIAEHNTRIAVLEDRAGIG